jgi:hypothetical protein
MTSWFMRVSLGLALGLAIGVGTRAIQAIVHVRSNAGRKAAGPAERYPRLLGSVLRAFRL